MKSRLFHTLSVIGAALKDFILHPHIYARRVVRTMIVFTSFFGILLIYFIGMIIDILRLIPLLRFGLRRLDPLWSSSGKRFFTFIEEKLENLRPFKIKRKYLIYVAIQNLKVRLSRSLITIFGMSVGIGIIVYLLSLGYGIERLVIAQVASLDELEMLDVSAGESSTATITKETIQSIRKIEHVKKTDPLISVVGRLDYKNAKTDVLVYGVVTDYFAKAKSNFIAGNNFTSSDIPEHEYRGSEKIAGVTSTMKHAVKNTPITSFRLHIQAIPGQEVPVYEECSMEAEILGFVERVSEGDFQGMEFYGSQYAPYDPYGRIAIDTKTKTGLGSWIKAEVPILNEECTLVTDSQVVLPADRKWAFGCIPRKFIQVKQEVPLPGEVLSESTSSAELSASASALLDEGVEESSTSALFANAQVSSSSSGLQILYLEKKEDVTKKENVLKYPGKVSGKAIISSGLMQLLGLTKESIKNESFKLSLIIIKSLVPTVPGRTLTEEQTYQIAGVIDDDENQFAYIPIQDIEVLGVTNYSQVKVQLEDKKFLESVRTKIEQLGFKTASTADTISEIEAFFGGLRSVLAVIGFIALAVASLGMFNTLTVSLLERTREIGGMKTMGMVSGEIQELFLAEAMIMGFGGGIGGLLLGYLVGQVTTYAISIVAIAQGVGYLNLTHIPLTLSTFIIISSFVVGLITGLYPSYRAKRISALNALRYE